MKLKRFNENEDKLDLEYKIENIISTYVDTEKVPYTDDYEISSKSIKMASKQIIKYLKTQGLLFALDANRYNL